MMKISLKSSKAKRIINIVIILVLLFLTIITYSNNIRYLLLIDSSVPIEKLILQERNMGFKGARLNYIIQKPNHPEEIIAKGSSGNYYSKNNGNSWDLLSVSSYKYKGYSGYEAPNVFWDKN